MHLSLTRRWLALWVLFVSSSCSLLVADERRQCQTDADCRTDAKTSQYRCDEQLCQPPLGGDWMCLEGAISLPDDEVITFKLSLFNSAGDPVADAAIRACASIDTTCTNPLAERDRADEGSHYTIDLQRNFNGFFEVKHPDYLTALLFVNPFFKRENDQLTTLLYAKKKRRGTAGRRGASQLST
jgi:hypothetical protein